MAAPEEINLSVWILGIGFQRDYPSTEIELLRYSRPLYLGNPTCVDPYS